MHWYTTEFLPYFWVLYDGTISFPLFILRVECVWISLLSIKKFAIEEGKFLFRELKTKRRLANFTNKWKVGILSFLKEWVKILNRNNDPS